MSRSVLGFRGTLLWGLRASSCGWTEEERAKEAWVIKNRRKKERFPFIINLCV